MDIENTEVNEYEKIIALTDIKFVLGSSKNEFIQRPGVFNVIPECNI